MEIFKGDITVHTMSNLAMFVIKQQEGLDYLKLKKLSSDIVAFCLENDIGVIFNFEGYADKLIKEMDPWIYFEISDDFIQLNAEFLDTTDVDFMSENAYNDFNSKFYMFDCIFDVLRKYEVQNIDLVISCDGSAETLSDFIAINKNEDLYISTLYKAILDHKDVWAFEFPNLIIKYNN